MSIESKNIRNVVLLGHSGCGKTSFSECMLFEAGVTSRPGTVDDGSTVSDHTMIEKERGNTVFSTLMHAHWKGSKINVIDTPGLDDFVGEVISSLKVADTALVLLNARSGVEVSTELIWEYIEKFNSPAVLVVNQCDHERSDFNKTLEQAQTRFGDKVMPVQYPLNQGTDFNKIVDALRMIMYVFPEGGGKPSKEPIPDSELGRAQEMHAALVEAAAENDDSLMEKYFDAGSLNEEELAAGLTIALAKQTIFPLFCTSATQNMGSGRIMGFLHDIAPSPIDRPDAPLEGGGQIACNAEGTPVAFVFKTLSEPKVGRLSYFKVYSGKLKSGLDLYNSKTNSSERMSQLFVANGKDRTSVDELAAGDLGVTVKLKDTHTNDTLAPKGSDIQIQGIKFPNARIRVAVKPPGKGEIEKLATALHKIEEEDPTLRMELSKELRQTLLHGQGELHLDLIRYRIEKVNNIKMEFERPKIPYRETIRKEGGAHYKHKKQSGGSGQFGEVHMRIVPYSEGMTHPSDINVRKTEITNLDWGGCLAFNNCIVGGAIDNKYMSAIKKGILLCMEDGPITGSYCRDVAVYIVDGKMHAVDSNDMAFQLAGSAAFKEAFKDANPLLMEPIYHVDVLCSNDVMGDVMTDLQGRRAVIMGMGAEGHYQKIEAKVPLVELYKYSSSLRSISQGLAKFDRRFSEYSSCPADVQAKLVSERNAAAGA